MNTQDLPYRVVVAIDFGTSGSGYAAAAFKDGVLIRVPQWPDQPEYGGGPKNRTFLLYSPEGRLVPGGWGFSASAQLDELQAQDKVAGHRLLRGFKMALRYGKIGPDGPLFDPGDGGPSLPVLDLIADYLAQMKAHVMRQLKPLSTTEIADRDVFWCLTVPALWENKEKHWMREAAKRAGLIGDEPDEVRRLCLVLEPEAAALYCLDKDQAIGLSQLTHGKRFMVIDAGGGTIDLTVHEVTERGGLDEVVQSSGRACGSTQIDRAFEAHFAQRFGATAVADCRRLAPAGWTELMYRWERAKCAFDPADRRRQNANVPLPADVIALLKSRHAAAYQRVVAAQKGLENYFVVDKASMVELFEPTIREAVETVQTQLDGMGGAGLDFAFLVGGFGQSPLLRQRLEEAIGDRVRVVVPPEAGAAVMLGAVLFGLDTKRIARRSRYTYGIRVREAFEHGVDPPERAFTRDGEPGVFCWKFHAVIEKDDLVGFDHTGKCPRQFAPVKSSSPRITFRFYRTALPLKSYFDETQCREEGSLTIQMPDGSPLGDRTFEVSFHCGRTEIAATVTDVTAKLSRTVMLDFRSDRDG